jgi:hypothetical protein
MRCFVVCTCICIVLYRTEVHRRFGGTFFLHHQGRRVNRENDQQEARRWDSFLDIEDGSSAVGAVAVRSPNQLHVQLLYNTFSHPLPLLLVLWLLPLETRGSVVGLGTMLQATRLWVRFLIT